MSTPTGTDGQGQAPAVMGQQAGQAPPVQQSTTGQPQGQGQDPATQQPATTPPDLSVIQDPALRAWVEAQVRQATDARQEAARYRTERNTLEQTVNGLRQTHETEQQRQEREQQERDQRFQALEAENRTLRIGSQFTDAAVAAKALDPGALLHLIGGADRLELGDDGKVSNAAALIQEAQTKYPWAFSRTNADGAAGQEPGSQPGGSTSMNDLIRGRASAQAAR